MKAYKIDLREVSKVKEFVQAASNAMYDVILESEDGNFRVDGKSILGVFSLDLSKVVVVKFNEAEEELFKGFI